MNSDSTEHPPAAPPAASVPAEASAPRAPSSAEETVETPRAVSSGSSADATTQPGRGGAADPPLQIGTLLGDYRLEAHIGSGAFGNVWRAFSVPENRSVALKLLPRALSDDADEMQRVQRCFQTIHELHHEHICPVYRLARDERMGYYLVMRFIEGAPLNQWRATLTDAPPPNEHIVEILRMIARALDYAHAHRVLHRDVKPANILRTHDGRDVQVVDFGLAEQIHSSMSRVSNAALATAGTPAYMSPEACRGAPQDARSDQYSLACVSHYLLTGRPPFDGAPWVVLNCHRETPPPPIPEMPDAVNQALARGLAKIPQDRFPRCAEFVAALNLALMSRRRSPPPQKASAVVTAPAVAAPAAAAPRLPHARDGIWLAPSQVAGLPARALEFGAQSETLFALRTNGILELLEPESSAFRTLLGPGAARDEHLAPTPHGGFVIVGGRNDALVVDATVGRTVVRIAFDDEWLTCLCTLPGGREVCCATSEGRLAFVNLASGEVRRTLRTAWEAPGRLCVSPNGRWLAEFGAAGLRLHVLTATLFSRTQSAPGIGAVRFAEFSRDSRFLLLSLSDGRGVVYDPARGKSVSTLQSQRRVRMMRHLDGNRLACIGDGDAINVVDAETARISHVFPLPACPAHVAVSPRGLVAIALEDGRILVSPDVNEAVPKS
ncbi:Serine/threonine-protein kinase PrkC [Phycisphaerae bacterium RAS1]|nr:Serine/threonine-protein kinase PrkC [Phycisphaerae bacterium RAS1]